MNYDTGPDWLVIIFLLTCTLYAAHAVGKQEKSPRIDRGDLTVWSEQRP